MTSTETDHDNVLTYCERHPGVETALTCGRCEAYICPRCMVHTPGGIRCPDCARLRRPVMYELETKHYLLALAVALGVALPLGVAAAIVLPVLRFGFFGLILGFLAGTGAGALMAEAISRVTRYKRGLALQLIGSAGLLLAAGLYLVASGLRPESIPRDIAGLAAVVGSIMAVWGRLR
ncbi:MAG: hypothetical protein GEU80_15430 [Dehalococcoidia bacterium]|nr:hypothetical protein [Dehalococcoidia bacterium]